MNSGHRFPAFTAREEICPDCYRSFMRTAELMARCRDCAKKRKNKQSRQAFKNHTKRSGVLLVNGPLKNMDVEVIGRPPPAVIVVNGFEYKRIGDAPTRRGWAYTFKKKGKKK